MRVDFRVEYDSILLAVVTHDGNKLNQEFIRESSWWASCPTDKKFVVAGKEGDHLEDVICVGGKESYARLPNKIMNLFRYVVESTNYQYLIKCDDDVHPFLDELMEYCWPFRYDYMGIFCDSLSRESHIGREGLCQPYEGDLTKDYCSGPMYIISRRAMEIFIQEDPPELHLPIGYEDMMVGNLFHKYSDRLTAKDFMEDGFTHAIHFVGGENMIRHSDDVEGLRKYAWGMYHHIAGDKLYNSGNHKKAFEHWLKGAESGHLQCMKNVAWAYSAGIGVPVDLEKSKEWLERKESGEQLDSAIVERYFA